MNLQAERSEDDIPQTVAIGFRAVVSRPGLSLETVSRPENHGLRLGLDLGPFGLGLGLGLITRGPRSRPRPQFAIKMLVLESFLNYCESFRNHDSLHGAIITLITVHCECNV